MSIYYTEQLVDVICVSVANNEFSVNWSVRVAAQKNLYPAKSWW